MRIAVSLSIVSLFAGSAAFAQGPDWAYQSVTEDIPAAHEYDPDMPRTVPGSSLSRTQPQIDDHWNPPDWFPDQHGPVPEVVAHGNGPDVRGCAACHGFTGMGHPESSQLAGYTVNYILNQLTDFKNGSRKDRYWMNGIAAAISDEDARAAAEYFSALEPIDWIVDVVEGDTVPRTYIGDGRMRFVHPDGGTEPLGYKAIEVPEDRELATARHPGSGFIAYVPEGSVARGQALVTTGESGKTVPCMACHGIDLKGVGDIPAIAGSSPVYAIRQLNDFKTGDRAGNMAALMRPTVVNLTTEDMVDIVAYLATLDP